MTTDVRTERRFLHAFAAAAPVVACLFCPLCLPAAVGLLSVLGVGIFIGEALHGALIGTSVVLAVGSAALLTRRHRKVGPLALTIAGGIAVVVGCVIEASALEYAGTIAIGVAALWNWRLRRPKRPPLFQIQTRNATRAS